MAKRERPVIKPIIEPTSSTQEELLQKLQAQDDTQVVAKKKKSQRKIRFTMDLPEDIHTKIANKSDDNGQTMKGYILKLVKADLLQ